MFFYFTSRTKIDHGTCTFFPFKVSTVGQKPFLLLGRGGIWEVLVPFDSHEVSCFCFSWRIFDGISMHGLSVDYPAIGWGDSLVALADSKCSLEFWQHRIWMRCFPNFQGRVVLVWKRFIPKGSWKRSLPAFWIPIIFQGGWMLFFCWWSYIWGKEETSNGSQRSWILKFVTSDSPKTWLYYRPKRRPLLNFAVPHRHTAVDGWWSSKILTTWHLQKWMIDDERGLQWCTVCYHYFRPLFIAIILGKFHRDHSRAVGKFPQMSFYNSGWEIRVISHTVGGSYL